MKAIALTLAILLSITLANAGITDNLSIGSGMKLPDKGVEWNYNYRNGDQSAWASMTIQVKNDGVAGKYFIPRDVGFQIYSGYEENDPGLRRFSLNVSYIITSEKPEPEEFNYEFGGEYDSKSTEINANGNIYNGSIWVWNEEDWNEPPVEIITSDVITRLWLDIDSPSAEIYEIDCEVYEWSSIYSGDQYMEVRMDGTLHTPEPATMSLLAIGAISMLRRRRSRK